MWAIIGGVVTIVAGAFTWWLARSPARRAERERKENARISDMVRDATRGGRVGRRAARGINRLLRKWNRER